MTNPSAQPSVEHEVEPIDFKSGFRYLFHDATWDFCDAMTLGRQLRDRKISKEEFRAAMARRFPPLESNP